MTTKFILCLTFHVLAIVTTWPDDLLIYSQLCVLQTE